MESNQLRAVGYRRVSMKEQVDGFSLDAQENNIKQYIQTQGWTFVELYTDAGISAKKDSHRPALEKMMRDAETHRFNVIVVDKVDRFYRHLRGLLSALDQLNDLDVSFVSVQERLDFTTPWGKLTLTVLGTLAEIYIDNLRQETKKGKIQRARDGFWNGSIPYGYCRGLCSKCKEPNGEGYCPDFGKPDQGNGRILILHPIESQVVRLIYDWYLTGEESCGSIAKRFLTYPTSNGQLARSHGVPGWKPSRNFGKRTIHNILMSPFYVGLTPYFGNNNDVAQDLFPGKHPAIITQEEYNKAQETRKVLRRSPRFKHTTSARIYLLSGLLHCGYCGKLMRGSSSKRGRYFYRDATNIDKSGTCLQSIIYAEQIETQVVDWIMSVLLNTVIDEKYAEDETIFRKAYSRFERVKELYMAGELEHPIYLQEKGKYESIKTPLQETGLGAIIPSVQIARNKFSAWQNLMPIDKKRLLKTVIQAVFIQGSALVAIQPIAALLPFAQVGNRTSVCNITPSGLPLNFRFFPVTHRPDRFPKPVRSRCFRD